MKNLFINGVLQEWPDYLIDDLRDIKMLPNKERYEALVELGNLVMNQFTEQMGVVRSAEFMLKFTKQMEEVLRQQIR